ncbi:MAG TPA: anti-sigma factor [Devosia sp.]|nr:anti-sigma factor [Devosia sp.]
MSTERRNDSGEVSEELLHAYADGQLDQLRRAAVEAWLEAHPERAAEIALWQRQNAAIATLYGPVAGEPVPSRLSARHIAWSDRRRRRGWTRVAAAAVLLLGLGLGGGWYLRGATWAEPPASARLIEGAIMAHNVYIKETRHAVEVGADDRTHLVTWLSNRVGRPIGTPDLSADGYQLVGGRLLPPLAETGTGPAAQLMYQKGSDRVTLYITAAAPGGEAFQTETQQGLSAYYWANGQIACTVVGDLPAGQMQGLADGVYRQLGEVGEAAVSK